MNELPVAAEEDEDEELHPVVVKARRKGVYVLPNLFTLAALFGRHAS